MQFTITIPDKSAEYVKAKVESGDYASDSEVFRAGLRLMKIEDAKVEVWLRTEVVRSCEEHAAHPELSFPASELMDRLHASYQERQKAKSEKPIDGATA